MPNVVVAGGIIQCSHSGTVKLSPGDTRLAVNGSGAITFGQEAGLSFAPGSPGLVAPCPETNPSTGSPSPCTQTLPATTGVSTLLTIAGAGVLLATAQGQAVNLSDPSAMWSIAFAGQTLLSAEQ